VFKVLPNGEITDIRFTERSNNSYLDESAYKAIVKSSPVAPHPPAIKEGFVVVAIVLPGRHPLTGANGAYLKNTNVGYG